jgi:hypothetical protein
MTQIIRETGRQKETEQQQSDTSSTRLDSYFNALNEKDQLNALQKMYSQKAGEFKQLAGSIDAPKITLVTPPTASEVIYDGIPILKPEDKKDDRKNDKTDDIKDSLNDTNDNLSASNKTDEADTNKSQTKTITF